MVPFLDPVDREIALSRRAIARVYSQAWTRFTTRATCGSSGEVEAPPVPASMPAITQGSARTGLRFGKAGVVEAVLFPSDGLSADFFSRATTPACLPRV